MANHIFQKILSLFKGSEHIVGSNPSNGNYRTQPMDRIHRRRWTSVATSIPNSIRLRKMGLDASKLAAARKEERKMDRLPENLFKSQP